MIDSYSYIGDPLVLSSLRATCEELQKRIESLEYLNKVLQVELKTNKLMEVEFENYKMKTRLLQRQCDTKFEHMAKEKRIKIQCENTNASKNYDMHLNNDKIIVDKKEMIKLRDEMIELASQVSEVMQHKVNIMTCKIETFIEGRIIKKRAETASGNNNSNKSKLTGCKLPNDHFAIPVITNRFAVLGELTSSAVNDNVSGHTDKKTKRKITRKKNYRV
jgi:hypothetical protein